MCPVLSTSPSPPLTFLIMGHRITWRSRPRSEYPWLFQTERKNLADLEIGTENPHEYLVGPLSMFAVVELLHRVSELTYTLSGTTTEGSSSGSGTITLSRYDSLSSTWIAVDELEVFAQHRSITPPTGGESTYTFEQDTAGQYSQFQPVVPQTVYYTPWGDTYSLIFEDENGMFWLQGYFLFNPDTASDAYVGVDNAQFVGTEGLLFDADLVLSCGTFPIKAVALDSTLNAVTSASLTITATKWFPYATTTGADAYEISTGTSINGGPGV